METLGCHWIHYRELHQVCIVFQAKHLEDDQAAVAHLYGVRCVRPRLALSINAHSSATQKLEIQRSKLCSCTYENYKWLNQKITTSLSK